jgi:hypothetical protein
MDNHHGKGWMGIEGVYVYSGACKLHSADMKQKEQELDGPLVIEDADGLPDCQ